jgi:hypothetical protein
MIWKVSVRHRQWYFLETGAQITQQQQQEAVVPMAA